MAERRSAVDLLAVVTDEGTFKPWDEDVISSDPLGFGDVMPYRDRLRSARARTGRTESVLTGHARVRGHEVALILGDFGFLAGTMGVASSERVVRAFERAEADRLPVVAMPTSGGTRMQEGTLAFVRMATVAAAVRRYRDAGLPYLVYLRHPTTGGVLASWGSLGTVTFAEPGALLGLTGPRVVELMTGEPFPEGVQVAENLHHHGLVDDLVAVEDLPERLARVLAVLDETAEPSWPDEPPLVLPDDREVDPWAAVQRARRTDRPGVRELLAACASEMTALRGDGAGGDDPGCITALTRLAGVPVVVIAQDRPPGHRGARLGAVGYRKARRAMELADEVGLPIVTFIDTEGAQTSVAAEEGGLAREIARCLATMSSVSVPTLSVLLGEGTGGGAIALLPADRVVAAQHAWLSPIAPEGASAILHRTTERAAELAAAQGVSSTDLRRAGIVDLVLTDRPLDDEDQRRFADRVTATTGRELCALIERDPAERLAARRRRYRGLGELLAPEAAPPAGP